MACDKIKRADENRAASGRRVIFLDVDGVLNSASTYEFNPNGCIGVDDRNIKRLKRLIDETKAEIALSSDRRLDLPAFDYLCKRLSEHGLYISGKTPDLHNYRK